MPSTPGPGGSASLLRALEELTLRFRKAHGAGKHNHWKTACVVLLFCVVTAFAAASPTYKKLFHFSGTNGANSSSLVQGTDGNLYGTTQGGGANSAGTVFKITPGGTLTTLYNFCSAAKCSDGEEPESGLLLYTNGNLYGTTYNGGAQGYGTIFKITPAGKLTTLYSFCSEANCSDGALPRNPLILGADGNLHGTTLAYGANNEGGTVFKITSKGTLTTLYSFCADKCLDGSGPTGALVQGPDGNFYGTTGGGGSPADWGTAFKLTPKGVLTTLHAFCVTSCTDGATPEGLTLGPDGNLYGITAAGGADQYGTAFKITTGGTLTTLYDFCSQPGCSDGQQPISTVVEGTDGNFYGTASDGGTYGLGTIYALTSGGTLTTLHSFQGKYNGAFPLAALVQATSGIFYGTTSQGGKGGSIFSLAVGLGPFVETVQASGKAGQTIIILGQGFTGTTEVSFNGTSASFTVVSDTDLKAKIPTGATTGPITVATPGGTLTSNKPFVVKP